MNMYKLHIYFNMATIFYLISIDLWRFDNRNLSFSSAILLVLCLRLSFLILFSLWIVREQRNVLPTFCVIGIFMYNEIWKFKSAIVLISSCAVSPENDMSFYVSRVLTNKLRVLCETCCVKRNYVKRIYWD